MTAPFLPVPPQYEPPHPAEMVASGNGKDTSTSIFPRPEWAFWDYEAVHGSLKLTISALKYLDFLAQTYHFRIFIKRQIPTVVIETANGMEPTVMRGSLNATVKQYVVEELKLHYPDVANALLTTGKYFTLDLLEMLPPIDPVKARHSIFSQPLTTITLQTPLIKEQPFILANDIPMLGAGNLLVLMGRHGLGKSQFCELIASQAINPYCEPHSPFTINLPGGLILWIDTENPHNHMVRAINRIAQRTCADQDDSLLTPDKANFAKLRVERCAEIDDKMTWLMELVDSIHDPIDLIILDGALDLVIHMNDEAESSLAYYELRRLIGARQCALITTIHTSQKGDLAAVTPMGHWGALLGRKCDCLLQIRRSPEDPTIKEVSTDFNDHTKNRSGLDVGIYAAFQWHSDHNRPTYIDHAPTALLSKDTAESKAIPAFAEIFQTTPLLSYKELIARYVAARVDANSPVSEATAKDHLKKAVQKWHILQHTNGLYSHVKFSPSK